MSEQINKSPWKGLFSYTEEDKDSFYGRDDATEFLYTLTHYNTFVTLYGKSGIGKTSLLQAGLFPIMREDGYTPISVRFKEFLQEQENHDKPLIVHLIKKLSEACGIDFQQPTDADQETALWRFIYSTPFEREHQPLIKPLIILDQFEEILSTHRDAAELLLRQINALVDDTRIMPAHFHADNTFKIIIAIREDDLFRLEDSIDRHALSLLKQNRFRLGELSDDDARCIILNAGKDILDKDNQERIANKIIERVKENDENRELSSAILSLICDQLYKQYGTAGEFITLQQASSFGHNELEKFYLEATSHFTADQRNAFEQRLITKNGRRKMANYEELNELLDKKLDTLIGGQTGILYRPDKKNIELIHDLLAKVIFESRQKREAEEVRLKEAIKNIRKRKLFKTIITLLSSIIIIAGIVIWAFTSVSPRILEGPIHNTTIGPSLHTYKVPSGELYLQEDVILKDNTFNQSHKIHTLRIGSNNIIGEAFADCDSLSLNIILDGANNSISGLWQNCHIDTVTITAQYRPNYIASWRDVYTSSNTIHFDIAHNNPFVIKLNDFVVIAKDESKDYWQVLHAEQIWPWTDIAILPDSITLDETSLVFLKSRGYSPQKELSAFIANGTIYIDNKAVSPEDTLNYQVTHISSNDTYIDHTLLNSFINLKYVDFPFLETVPPFLLIFRDNLLNVSIPQATYIGEYAFIGCDALKSVSFPQTTIIGKRAFEDCDALTSVSFPKATHIEDSAFYNCPALTSISFPNVTHIGNGTFLNCDALKSVSFPQTTIIGKRAFEDCDALTSVSFPKATIIGNVAFCCTALTSISFPNVTHIGNGTFLNCDALKSVSFPRATIIGKRAFEDCTALTSVSFPNATHIGEDAFYNCEALTTVSFPQATHIGEWAFYNNKNLKNILIGGYDIDDEAFIGCFNLETFKVDETPLPIDTMMQRYAVGNEQYINHLTLKGRDTIPSYLLERNFLKEIKTFFSDKYYSYKNQVYDKNGNIVLTAKSATEYFIYYYDCNADVDYNADVYTFNITSHRDLLDINANIYRKGPTIHIPYGKSEEYKHLAPAFKQIREMTLAETMYHYCLFNLAPYQNVLMAIILLLTIVTMVFVIEAIIKKRPIRKMGEYIGITFCLLLLYVILPFYYESYCYNLVISRQLFYCCLAIQHALVLCTWFVILIVNFAKRDKYKKQWQ